MALLLAFPLAGQVMLNPNPARVLGHPQLALRTANPNLVEGRELYSPRAVAFDTTVSPPHLYVADTANNRVLGWRDATQFANGARADIVVGQRDLATTFAQGPGAEINGLSSPTAVAVDSGGNLFVADSGNNRILRYPKPFDNPEPVKLPGLVIGQQSMGTRDANKDPDTGVISARTLRLSTASTTYNSSLFFDPQGGLYAGDAGNQRVLRYAAADIGAGAANGPAASLVLGQLDFTTPVQNPTFATDLTKLYVTAGLGMDPVGRLYVCDAGHRVLVYAAGATSGQAAVRMIGGVLSAQYGVLRPPNQGSLNGPQGVFFTGDLPYVVDSGNHRILRYKRYEEWPADPATSPSAEDVIGQADFAAFGANRGLVAPTDASVCFQGPAQAAYLEAAHELFVADSGNHRLLVLTDPAAMAGSSMSNKRLLGQDSYDQKAPNLLEGREFYLYDVLYFVGSTAYGRGGGLVVDTSSNPPRLYVADTFNNRVLGFRDARNLRPGDTADIVIGQEKKTLSLVNSPEDREDRPSRKSLYRPVGLAVDGEGNLYVADFGNGRVLRFPKPFEHGDFPEADLVIGKPDFQTQIDPAADASPTNLSRPYGLALTVGGHLLVSDVAFNRVLLFLKPQGGGFTNGMAAEKVIGQPDFSSKAAGADANRLNFPHHISTDSSDRLYVCDTNNNRIQAFEDVTNLGPDPSAVSLSRVDQYNSLSSPQGVFVSPISGEIWVTSSGGTKVYRYPRFELPVEGDLLPDASIASGLSSERPLAVTVDGFGNLLVAYSTHRIGFYVPAMVPLNAANNYPRIAPGMMTSLYPLGSTFGGETASALNIPLPTELADIEVLVDGQPAPLFMVSPGQIKFAIPMGAPTSGAVELQVVRKSLGQVLAAGCTLVSGAGGHIVCGPVSMDVASPAFFAGQNYTQGTGQIAAVNMRASDHTYYGINSASNPVLAGDWLELYGTGQGFIPNGPPDGASPGGVFSTPDPKPQVIVNTQRVPDNEVWSGLNTVFVGLWQVNIRVPPSTPASSDIGPIVVAIVHRGILGNPPDTSNRTTIAVKR